mgnify:CR=1 FL=1
MSMKEAIQAEKARLQTALDAVTAPGATMSIFFPDGGSVRFEVDSFTVLRAMPQVDAEGNVAVWRYDLMFKEVGYDQGMQFVHLISDATADQPHGQSVMLEDEHGVVVAGGQGKLAGKIFRIGHLGLVSEDDIRQALDALSEVLPRVGFNIPVGR